MNIERALEISDRPNEYTHNEQIIARLTLAQEVRRLQPMEQRAVELAGAKGDHVRDSDRHTAQYILEGR